MFEMFGPRKKAHVEENIGGDEEAFTKVADELYNKRPDLFTEHGDEFVVSTIEDVLKSGAHDPVGVVISRLDGTYRRGQGVDEARGNSDQLYMVRCIGNFWGSKYYETGVDSIVVAASSADEAVDIARNNVDAIVDHFHNKRVKNRPALRAKDNKVKVTDTVKQLNQTSWHKTLTRDGEFVEVNVAESVSEADDFDPTAEQDYTKRVKANPEYQKLKQQYKAGDKSALKKMSDMIRAEMDKDFPYEGVRERTANEDRTKTERSINTIKRNIMKSFEIFESKQKINERKLFQTAMALCESMHQSLRTMETKAKFDIDDPAAVDDGLEYTPDTSFKGKKA